MTDTLDTDTENLYLITVATKPHPVLDILVKNIEIKGESIEILGLTDNHYSVGHDFHGGRSLGLKLQEVYKFINRPYIKNNDIVLFTDAYDVYYSGNKTTILERFKSFNKPIVFGSEKCCYPDAGKSSLYPDTHSCFRYLNSGLFIGRVESLRKCMENCENEFIGDTDDQLWWTNKFLDNQNIIELDYDNKLFLNCVWLNESEFIFEKDKVTFIPNRSVPQFIHGNGPSKPLIEPLLEYARNNYMNNIIT